MTKKGQPNLSGWFKRHPCDHRFNPGPGGGQICAEGHRYCSHVVLANECPRKLEYNLIEEQKLTNKDRLASCEARLDRLERLL